MNRCRNTRNPRGARSATAGLVLGLVASCPSAADARPFGPAEVLTYECQYLGLTVGRAQLMVGAATPLGGRSVWPIMGLVKTDPLFVVYPVKDKYVTWWDPVTHLTLGSNLIADENGKRRRERIRIDREAVRATTIREKEGQPREEEENAILPDAQDILATYFVIREERLAVGDKIERPVFTGKRNFMLKAEVDRKESVTVPAGTFDTVVLRVQVQFAAKLASKRDVFVYVTDDARHLPVRIDAELLLGVVAANLMDFQKGMTGP